MYVEGRCGVDLVIDWVVGGSGMEALVTVEAKPQNVPVGLVPYHQDRYRHR
jgi:hypothetical protein